jgi:hypothetical protein
MGLWNEPASFWIGAGMVAEAPIMLISWIDPDGSCAVLGRFIECPLSIWSICVLGLISYFFVAWTAHKLGLGESKN